jgi:uncharacterized membrane protein YhhN
MKTIFKKYGFLLFIAVACVQLIAIRFNIPTLRILTKPLLMPVLAFIVYFNGQHTKRFYIIAGLLFSFLGDIFLLLEDKYPRFFIYGLASFLATHILYIIFFCRIKLIQTSLVKQHPYLPLLIAIYGAGLIYLLNPFLGALKVPVILYAVIICGMLLTSIHVYKSVGTAAGSRYIMGASLFVMSDSLLAVNKFYQSIPSAGLFIMLTYCAAQYFIVRGFISQEEKIAVY